MKKEIFPALLLLLLAGCATAEKTADGKDPEEPVKIIEHDEATRLAGRELAQRYMDAFTCAVRENDFKPLQAVLPPGSDMRLMRSRFAEQNQWIREKLGNLAEYTFSDTFRQGAICDYIWKISFSREENGNESIVDLPYRVRVMVLDGKVQIVMVGFSFPAK